jgi:hypothetical protein
VHRPWHSPSAWAAAAGLLLALFSVALVWLSVLARQPGNGIIALVIGVPSAGVGVLVARRQPGNPLGWIFLAVAACLILSSVGGDYAVLVYRSGRHLPLGETALALYELWTPGLLLLGVIVLLFPSGRTESRFWQWVLRTYLAIYAVYVIADAVATIGALAAHPLHVDSSGGLTATDNPSGWFGVVQSSTIIPAVALWVGAIVRQALSWHGSSGDRRQQLKWLALGAAAAVLGLGLAAAGFGLGWFAPAALPVAIGVGILKYRLYDIDRIISRTLAYAIVTGLLVGVYAGLVLLATQVFRLHSTVAVAASTLAAAALFNPVRRRVQRAVDRRFNRARYDADQTVAAFAARLKGAVDLDSVRDDLAGVVHQTLEPAHVSVWLSPPDRGWLPPLPPPTGRLCLSKGPDQLPERQHRAIGRLSSISQSCPLGSGRPRSTGLMARAVLQAEPAVDILHDSP